MHGAPAAVASSPRAARQPIHSAKALDEMFRAIRRANSWREVATTLIAHDAALTRAEGENFAVVYQGRLVFILSPITGTLPELVDRLGPVPPSLVGPPTR